MEEVEKLKFSGGSGKLNFQNAEKFDSPLKAYLNEKSQYT